MAQGLVLLDDPVQIDPGTWNNSTWTDVDVSASVGADAVGVLIQITTSAGLDVTVGARKNGSTDTTIVGAIDANAQKNAILLAGLDVNKIFEIYSTSAEDCNLYLIGYMDGDSAFDDNSTNLTPGSTGWQNVDFSAYAPLGATVAWVTITCTADFGNKTIGIRKNIGAGEDTDTFLFNLHGIAVAGINAFPIPLDANRTADISISSTTLIDIFYFGYSKDIVMLNNKSTLVGNTENAWTDEDLTALTDATANGALFLNKKSDTASNKVLGGRKNGSSTDTEATKPMIYGAGGMMWACKLDTDNIYEYFISTSTSETRYLLGYTYEAGGGTEQAKVGWKTLLGVGQG